MLRKNKIFLDLLGSFYENTAYTDFSMRIDYVYTSIIFNRYANTIRSMVLKHPSSKGKGIVNFGFIKASEIDPSHNTITIRNVNGVVVNNANYISLNFLDIEKFYRINNGNEVTIDLMNELSSIGYQTIPVTYMSDVSDEIFRNGYFRFVDNVSDADIFEIKKAALRIVSDHAAYMPNSTRTIHKMSNILLGCVYAKDFETVIDVSNDMVVTTKNTYYLSGVNADRAIVSVGDELSPSDMITMLCTVTSDMSFLDKVRKAEIYINSISPSFSNMNFLSKISNSLAKKKISIEIYPDVFAETDTEIVSAMNSLFSVVSSVSAVPSSGSSFDSHADGEISAAMIVSSAYVANAIIRSGWILDIEYSSTVGMDYSDGIILDDSSSPYVSSDLILTADPIIDGMEVFPEDTISNIIEDNISAAAGQSEKMNGLYVDTNIAEPIDESSMLISDSTESSIDDGGAVFNELTVVNEDEFAFSELDKKEVSAREVVVGALSDIVNHIYTQVDMVRQADVLLSNTEVNDFSVVSSSSVASSILAEKANALIHENGSDSTIIELTDAFDIKESNTSDGSLSRTDHVVIDDDNDISTLLMTVKETIFMEDSSDVESENRIDS